MFYNKTGDEAVQRQSWL